MLSIAILSLSVSILILLAFSQLAKNVREIRDFLSPAFKNQQTEKIRSWRTDYWRSKSFGDKAGQVTAITNIIYDNLLEPGIGAAERDGRYLKLKEKYNNVFEECGYSFPPHIN